MTTEWLKVMLEEIARKQAEERQARIEEDLRRGRQPTPTAAPAVVLQCTKVALGE
jgi:hypothetical protein